jgi:hypothetical protein
MARSRRISASAARTASKVLRGGSYGRASKRVAGSALSQEPQEPQEPREIVLRDEDLHALGSGRGCVIRDGVAVYYD